MQVWFDLPMDTDAIPAVGSFEVLFDGVPQTPTLCTWPTPDHLQLAITPGFPVTVSVNLLSVDLNLRSSVGTVAIAPQSQVLQ